MRVHDLGSLSAALDAPALGRPESEGAVAVLVQRGEDGRGSVLLFPGPESGGKKEEGGEKSLR
jgi:hypothetical protein